MIPAAPISMNDSQLVWEAAYFLLRGLLAFPNKHLTYSLHRYICIDALCGLVPQGAARQFLGPH